MNFFQIYQSDFGVLTPMSNLYETESECLYTALMSVIICVLFTNYLYNNQL